MAIICSAIVLSLLTTSACGANANQGSGQAVATEATSAENPKEHMKKAYNSLCDSYKTMMKISDVIQTAWHYGIFEKKQTVNGLSSKTGISVKAFNDAGLTFDFSLGDFSSCVSYCVLAMSMDENYYSHVKECIDNAKNEIQNTTSEIDRYADMKNFYSTSLSYYEWLLNPQGNFNQATDSINEYENKLKEFKNDLEFDYGD